MIKEAEAREWVTHRNFGTLLEAGITQTFPKVVNAQSVTGRDLTITTPGGDADCYFAHPASGSPAAVLVSTLTEETARKYSAGDSTFAASC